MEVIKTFRHYTLPCISICISNVSMTASDFYKLLIQKFPFKPTLKQTIALEQLSNF
ncbi:MAG: hypothetical protein ACI8QQ_002508, partial [Psychroserpens sp.]